MNRRDRRASEVLLRQQRRAQPALCAALPGSLAGKQSICLSIIVKNENGPHLQRCLESVRPFITSWAAVDTGSTDGTQDAIRAYMRDVPGQLIEREWVDDFALSRNQALELARESGADFAMVLDADDYVVARDGIAKRGCLPTLHEFQTDVVSLAGIDEGKQLLLATFIRLGTSELRFHGRVHELVVQPDGSLPIGVADPSYATHRTREGAASADSTAKQEYYRRLLLLSVSENKSDTHAWEALARDALARMDGEAARLYLDEALRWIPAEDRHRLYVLRLSRISTFRPLRACVGDVLAEIEALMLLCPERAEAPRWMARELRKIGQARLADRLDGIADGKSVPPDAYGIDHGCYAREASDPTAVTQPLKRRQSMRYIVLPEPIAIDSFLWTFNNCVSHIVDNEQAFASPASMIRAGQRILSAIDKAADEKKLFVALKDEDHEQLKIAFESPVDGYGAFVREIKNDEGAVVSRERVKVAPRLFLPFIDAVMDAASIEPTPAA